MRSNVEITGQQMGRPLAYRLARMTAIGVGWLVADGRTETAVLTESDKVVARLVHVIEAIAHTAGSPVRARLPVCSSQTKKGGEPTGFARPFLAVCQ